MRVGLDAWGLSGELLYTGMGQYAAHLLEGLAEAGDLEVFAYGAPGEQRPAWLPAAVAWRVPDVPGPSKTSALFSRLFALGPATNRDGLDLFHSPAVHVRPSLPPVASVRCPLAVTVHDLIPLTFYGSQLPLRLRLFYRWNLRRALRAGTVLTVSEFSAGQLARQTGVQAIAIPNGVAFEPNPDREPLTRVGLEQRYVLFAGSYEPRKNLLAALEAYALAVRSGLPQHLVAVVEGRSGHALAIHERIRALGLEARVHLVHSLPEPDLRSLYTHADVLFFPSLAEGFGLPPLQAAACSVATVASDIAPVRESLGEAAFYVDPGSVDSMAAGLTAALSADAGRREVGASARERSRAFTWERSVRRHLAAYCRALEAAPAGALPGAVGAP